jgi:DNA processing protein
VYPLCNKDLFEDVRRYGCLISEFPPGTPPNKWNFPKRNRIIAGISCGVLVVEAPEKSGALITARQALDQGRDVFVVPGNIDVDSFVGSNRLLRDGAIAVSSGWDVLSEYEGLYPDKIRKDEKKVSITAYSDETALVAESDREAPKVAQEPAIPKKKTSQKRKTDKKVIDNGLNPPYSDVNTDMASLSNEERAIAETLLQGEKLVDDVIAETGLGTAKVLAHLTILEIRGIIQRLPGKRIRLKR